MSVKKSLETFSMPHQTVVWYNASLKIYGWAEGLPSDLRKYLECAQHLTNELTPGWNIECFFDTNGKAANYPVVLAYYGRKKTIANSQLFLGYILLSLEFLLNPFSSTLKIGDVTSLYL
ncbi:uncharacterized protein CBL_20338 [Carabus blaptoides fortunei]